MTIWGAVCDELEPNEYTSTCRLVLVVSDWRPAPGVVKRLYLRRCSVAGERVLAEDYVIAAVGVERRIEVHEVNRLSRNVLAHDMQVAAVVELVPPPCLSHRPSMPVRGDDVSEAYQ